MTDLDGRDEHVISQVLDAIDDALDALRDGTAHVRGERERTPLEWVSTALLFAKLCLHDNEFRALVEAGHQELIDNGVLT
ncbi:MULTISPECIES: hypothetical protein [unclassified Burkholderia]|uniref:hypothetical protein n=1 Tax=unclassified Burkholderia TaxID=2613784 RepID=UPI000F5E63C2|nr:MULTISPECIES: hypothetical protein [unclassified Burkholderia]